MTYIAYFLASKLNNYPLNVLDMYRPTTTYIRSEFARCIPMPLVRTIVTCNTIIIVDGWVDSSALTPTLDDCRVKLRAAIRTAPITGTVILRNVDIATNADLLLLLDALCCAKCELFDLSGVRFTDLTTIRQCLAQWAAGIRANNRTGLCIQGAGGTHYWDIYSYMMGL